MILIFTILLYMQLEIVKPKFDKTIKGELLLWYGPKDKRKYKKLI